MYIQDFIVKHGIVTIGVIYFSFNLLHKKLINLVTFLSALVFSYPFFDNKLNGLIFSLVASLCLGIARNFHLLENFEDHKKIVRLSNRLLDKIPSYKINKVTIDSNDIVTSINVSDKEIDSMKQELESGYSNIQEYPIFVSKDNVIIQGNIIHTVLLKYPELDSNKKRIYKINETKEYVIKRIPMIKLMSGLSEDEFNLLDISKM
jgi:hypothetical protein